MKLLMIIAMGGAMGALSRHLVNGYITNLIGGGFPWGILTVNIVGSILLGAVVEITGNASAIDSDLKTFLTVGVLGAFTTFSTFSLDVVEFFEKGFWLMGLVYVFASLALAVGGLVAGMCVTRGLIT